MTAVNGVAPPNGVKFKSKNQLRRAKAKLKKQSVRARASNPSSVDIVIRT
jgi:hypothetical protein